MITDWNQLESKHSIRKIYTIEKNLPLLFFRPTFKMSLYQIKSHGPYRNRYNWSTVLKIFFPDNMSPIAHLYECVMPELWVIEHSGFMKAFVSFSMKNTHPFNVPSIQIDLFLFKLTICDFLQMKFSDSKEWLQMYSLISLSQCPLKTSVHTVSLVFSWVQIRSVFNGTETIALLGLKIWNLVLLVINQKKYINDFFYNDLGVLHCLYWFNFMNELNRSKNC